MTGMFMFRFLFSALLNFILGEPWYQLCDAGKYRLMTKYLARSRRKSATDWTLLCAWYTTALRCA